MEKYSGIQIWCEDTVWHVDRIWLVFTLAELDVVIHQQVSQTHFKSAIGEEAAGTRLGPISPIRVGRSCRHKLEHVFRADSSALTEKAEGVKVLGDWKCPGGSVDVVRIDAQYCAGRKQRSQGKLQRLTGFAIESDYKYAVTLVARNAENKECMSRRDKGSNSQKENG